MTPAPVRSAPPGTCPLCQCRLPDTFKPRTPGDVVTLLGEHFGTACPATAFTIPVRSL